MKICGVYIGVMDTYLPFSLISNLYLRLTSVSMNYYKEPDYSGQSNGSGPNSQKVEKYNVLSATIKEHASLI